MENQSNNKNNWEARSAAFQSNIKAVLYKSFPDSLNEHLNNWHRKIVLDNIPDKDSINILDIGCGYGRISIPLLQRNKNIQITGVDISENFVKQYIINTNQKGIVCKIEELPDEIGKFDYIICIAVLMYVDNQNIDNVLTNVLTHLKKDGKIILIEPIKSGQFFLNGFGLLKHYNIKHKTTGGNSFMSLELKNHITKIGGKIIEEKRIPVTTIFILPLFVLSSLLNKNIMKLIYRTVNSLDNLISNLYLPSLNLSLIIAKEILP